MSRVFLIDDHVMLRAAVGRMLAEDSGMEIVGEAGDGRQALRVLADPAFEVDVVVLDLSMPRLNGLETLMRLKEIRPSLPVLVVSMYDEGHYARRVLEAGAAGYVSKHRSEQELIEAIRAVASGRVFARREHIELTARPEATLTAREHMVFMLLIGGNTVSEIAAELDLTKSTVSTHLARAKAKLGVTTTAGLIDYAHRAGLID